MRFKSIRPKFWPFNLRTPEQDVLDDADQLMETWGKAAYAVASTLSLREDIGLVQTELPGHWSRVKGEIGLRLGTYDDEPEAEFSADFVASLTITQSQRSR